MQDNAHSHTSKYFRAWFSDNDNGGTLLMTWPPNSPVLKLIEMLFVTDKQKVYENGKLYSSLDALWVTVRQASTEVQLKSLSDLVNDVDKGLFR